MRRKILIICAFLLSATVAVYWQVATHEFVNYDDDVYVTENLRVQAGLTRENLIWAFTTVHGANWHPLTWLSHILDCELYGLNSGGHHLTSVLFHLLNTLLLFLVLDRMTKKVWPSAFVAALFAIHPLHVESVAWVAERKDVLSTLFWLLTMWAYVRYVERPGAKSYLLTVVIFGLGLMAKPMLVTLPFVLLLVDYWPLDRFQADYSSAKSSTLTPGQINFLALIREKVPFLALAVVSSAVTLLVQQSGGAVESTDFLPIKVRIANGLVSYVSYMGKMIWPQGLAVFYPHPGADLPLWQAVGAGLLLAGISLGVVRAAKRHPYLLTGWFWYLGTLVPVIGLVQVGIQAMADRYTYVPLIGLFVMIAWGIPALVPEWEHKRTFFGGAAGSILTVLLACTWIQVTHWQNNITLFEHALQVTDRNYLAHDNLGNALAQQGKYREAIAHYHTALRIKSNSANTYNNLGVALFNLGKVDDAIAQYRTALHYQSDSPKVHNNLGVALAKLGRVDKAIAHYLTAAQLRPDYEEAYNNLGNAAARQGKLDEAAAHFFKALEIRSNYPDAHNNLGVALARQGRLDTAIFHFKEALRLKPDYKEARANLQIALQQAGQTPKEPHSAPE